MQQSGLAQLLKSTGTMSARYIDHFTYLCHSYLTKSSIPICSEPIFWPLTVSRQRNTRRLWFI
uniref:Uncharacterized protein n=1 Tax=Arundo donax TaxID=35708 RepID=A0A0A8Z413_ARUDO